MNPRANNAEEHVSSSSATILEFPRSRIVREVPSEAIEEHLRKGEERQVEDLVEMINYSFYEELMEVGVDTETEAFYKDFSYLAQVVAALVYRDFGIEHPLQEHLDETIKVLGEDEFEEMKKQAKEHIDASPVSTSDLLDSTDPEEDK